MRSFVNLNQPWLPHPCRVLCDRVGMHSSLINCILQDTLIP
jgi:hypothetical protein